MNITNILQTLFSRLVVLTLAVVFLSACNPEEVLDDGGYEIKLLSTESVFREGEQLSVGVFDKVTGEQDVSANISSNNQSFELDEYVWTTDNSDLAEMALEKTYKNQIITKAPGKVVITATNSKRQVSFELTIAPALLNSVVISPKAQSIYLGQDESFVVNGNYSDGSIRPITEGISWSIDNNDLASITNQGVVSSLNVGLVKVTASVTNELQQVKTHAVNLTITEAAVTKLDITTQSNIPLGRTGQLSAIAQFTDLTNDNVTTNVSWITTPEDTINIDAEGNITTSNMGQVTVSAVIDDGYGTEVLSNSVELTISEKVIETIDIVPENQVIIKDTPVISIEKQERFTVEATYSTGDKVDISLNESLVFTSSDTSIATVTLLDTGQFLIETFVEGTTTLTLSLPNRLDEQVVTERVLTVIKPVLTKIDISAQSDTFAVGLQVNWQAIGHYDDNTTKDISDTVTWSSSSSNLASFNQDKRSTLSVTDTGVTSITAQFINDREQLIVSEPTEVTLRSAIVVDVLTISDNANIIDGQVSVPQGVQVNFQLKGMLSDGSEQILSGVTWTATENELATLDSSSGILIATKDVSKLGVLTTTASIFIDDTNFSHDVIVTVTPAKLVSFAIELPENNGLYKGYSQPLKVMGTFSTDLTYDLTDVVTWSIDDASKDKVVLSSIKKNTLEMVNAGDVTINASYLDIYDENKTKITSLNFTVAPALLTSMSISAQLDSDKNGVGELDVVSVASGQNVLFSAIGTYSDNSTKEITEQVSWLSSSPSFLTIIETGEDGGQANTFKPTLEDTALTISALLTNDKQEDISSTFSFTIGDAVLENINLSPAALSFGLNVPAGKSVQLEIWGTYSDGSYKKITEDNAAVWSSNNLEIGTIVKETGLVTMEKGDPAALLITATETVSGNSFKGSLVLNRVDAIVEFIKITPDTSSAPWKLADGAQLNLKAFAVYSDLSEVEITEDENSTWSIPDVSDQAFISVENASTFKGLVTALTETENKVTVNLQNTTFGQTLITTADFVIGAAVLEFIEVSPTIQTITSGDTLEFTATGFTSNDETIDLTELATWSSQNTNVAEFNQASSNVLQGISAGSVYITASYTPTGQEELTSETQVTVEPAILRSISIHPTTPRFTEIPQNTPLFLKGNTDLLTATGLYSDGTTATINGSVDWSIDNTNVAYISSVGVITPVGLGDANLHVEIDVVELGETKTIYVDYPFTVIGPLLKFIDITPASPVFVLGMQQQFTAKGIYSDNSIVDLTNAVTWTTGRSNESAQDKAGNITNTGVFSAERLGSVTVNASHPDFDEKAIIKQTFVSIETLDHLVIEHAGGDVYAGQKLTLNAYGVTSNNKQVTFSNGLTWQVSAIATIDDMTNQSSTNSFTTNAAGVMTATATWTTDAGVTSKSIQIDIKDPLLTSISLSVDDNSIADGLTAQFTATGTYSDGSTKNITDDVSWNNLNESIFTISNTGLITSKQPGSGDVSVYLTNDSGNKISSEPVLVTIELPLVESLNISASTTTISRGTSLQLNLTGILTDGSTELPDGVSWNSDVESNAVISDSGLVTIPNDAVIGQMVTLTALVPLKEGSSDNLEKSIVITIGIAKLSSLTLSTDNQTVPRGSSTTISATGLLTDETVGLPTTVNWTSSDTSKATVDSNGLVTVVSNTIIGQQVTITATAPELADSTNYINKTILLTIGKPLLSSISLTSNQVDIPRGTKVSIVPTGTQSDGTSGISTTITWSTNEPTLSTVSSSGEVFIRNNATLNQNIVITATASEILGSANNISQSITLKVVSPLLSSMTLTTDNTTVPRGTMATVSASGTYTDATTKVPDSVVWTSSDTSIATVDSSSGEVTIKNDAVIGQQVTITATAPNGAVVNSDIVKTITLTVGQPLLISMALAASDVTNNEVPRGTSTTITPTGTQSDSTNDIATTITWTTSDASIATVDANGVVTIVNDAELNDTATITATANKSASNTDVVTQSITLTVIEPLLSSMTLSTDNTTIPRGTTATVSASGTYTDATTDDPNSVVWTSSDTSLATVDSTSGEVTIKDDAVIGQQVIITATAPNGAVVNSDIVKTINLTVGTPLVETLDILTTDSDVRKGRSLTLTKSVVMSDGDITSIPTLTWSSSNSIVATVDNTGVVSIPSSATVGQTAIIYLKAAETVGSSTLVTDSITITITEAALETITLTPGDSTIPRGDNVTLVPTGVLSDNSNGLPTTLTWSSADEDIATVSNAGVVTVKNDAVVGGTVVISVEADEATTNSLATITQQVTLTVGDAKVESITISNGDVTVARGNTLTLNTSVVMSDSDPASIPTLTWSSDDPSKVSVDVNGLITVQNSASVLSKVKITVSSVAFPGSSSIITDSVFVTVGAPLLESISLSPGDSDIRKGKSLTFIPTGTLTDGASGLPTTLTWSSDDESVATVSDSGVVTIVSNANENDTATITVSALESTGSSNPAIEQSVVVTAIAPLVEKIEITVNSVSKPTDNVAIGGSLQLGTLTTYSNGDTSTSATVIWEEVVDSIHGSVSTPGGLVTIPNTAIADEKLYIAVSTPTYDGSVETVIDSIELTIIDAVLASIQLNSGDVSIIQGNTLEVVATGTLTNGSSVDAETLSSTLTWSTNNVGEVDVSHISSGTASAHGLISVDSAASIGDSIITATDVDGVSTSITVTVAYPKVELALSASETDILVEDTITITPTFTTTSDSITDTDGYDSTQLTWSSSDDTIATVGASTGIVSALSPGSVTITAIHDVVAEDSANGTYAVASSPLTATIDFTVDYPLVEMSISPTTENVLLGETLTIVPTLSTTGDASVPSEYDSSNLTWTSSDTSVATVNSSGVVTSLTEGTTTITALHSAVTADAENGVYASSPDPLSQSASITVNAAAVVDFDIYAQTSTIAAEGSTITIDPVEIFSDKTTQALTDDLDWASDNADIIFVASDSNTLSTNSGSVLITTESPFDSDATATITATHATLGSKTLSVTFKNDNSYAISRIETSTPLKVVADNTKVQLHAVAIYNDNTVVDITSDTGNVWTTDDDSSTVTNGTVTIAEDTDYVDDNVITATFDSETATTTLDIKDATLVSIEVYPNDVQVHTELTQDFKAYGIYSYNAGAEFFVVDITDTVVWTSDDTTVLTNGGSTGAIGTAVYTATLSAITGTASVEVVSSISSITLEKSLTDISDDNSIQRLSYQMYAFANYAKGHKQNITEQVFWSGTSNVLINNATGYKGLVTPITFDANVQTITASLFTNTGLKTGSLTLNTSTRTLQSIDVTPATADLGDNAIRQFTATATYTGGEADDSLSEDVTDLVTWSIDTNASTHISNAAGSKGQLTSISGDITDITLTATLDAITDTSAVTRSNVSVSSLTLSSDTDIAVDETHQFTAEGVFTGIDNTDFTSRVVWTSSEPTKVFISNASETKGLATRIATGDVTITATYEALTITSGTIGTTP